MMLFKRVSVGLAQIKEFSFIGYKNVSTQLRFSPLPPQVGQ